MKLKPDAEDFRRFLNQLQHEEWIKNTERRSWPLFAGSSKSLQTNTNFKETIR